MANGIDQELTDAWQAYHAGDFLAAEATCERVLGLAGDHAAVIFLQSLIDYARGRLKPAIERLQQVLKLRPTFADAHNNLGNALAAQGQLAKAEPSFREALRLKPEYAEAMNNLANVVRDQGRLEESIGIYRRALELRPDYADCHNNSGIAWARLGRYQEAIASYRRALELRPAFAEPHNNLGIVHASQGRPKDAIGEFRQALAIRPDYADAWANLGVALTAHGQLDEAIEVYRRAVTVAPASARAHCSLGTALATTGRFNLATTSFRRALEINADYSEAHNDLGNALRELGELDEAEQHLRRAIALKRDHPEAHNNLGVLFVKQRQFAAAVAEYDAAIRQRPDFAEAHLNRALAWLATGDFRKGWVEYEWRWRTAGFQELVSSQPRWDGGLLDGKTILLWSEQGIGDTLQFVRYARLVRQRGARVWFKAPRALHPLLSRTPGIDRLIAEDEQPPSFDCHSPLVSLPRLLATTLDDIPAGQPYLFPSEQLVRRRQAELEALGEKLKVGIGWRGNPRFASDRERSIPLVELLPLTKVSGVQLVSLQKNPEMGESPTSEIPSQIYVPKGQLDEAAGAFMDTAAIMASLDLVITSDSALAHLAGGMGAPTWLLLPYAADWRWLTNRTDSPWYPTMRLFRQASPGDWASVFSEVAAALREVLARRTRDQAIVKYSDGAHAWNSRGVALAERGELDEAIALFRRALRYDPNLAEAHSNLGNALRHQGKFEEAVERLRRAIAIQPEYAEAHHNLGIVFARQQQHEKAIASFRTAIEHKPDFAIAWNSLGLSQAGLGSFAEAEASFRKALEIDPRSPRTLNNLGNALADAGKRDAGVQYFERALAFDPNYAEALNNLGNSLRDLGRLDQAIASFERALAIRPEFNEAHNNLGIAWANKGEFDRAIACYQEALRVSPGYAAAHNNLGIALGHRHRYEEAVASYHRALELKPDYAEAHNNLGIVLSQQGEYDEAIRCYRRAIELKPSYAEAYSNLGITFSELGQLDDALQSYDEALRLKPNYPDAYMNRSLAFLARGDFQRGWQEYELRWNCKDFKRRNFDKPQWAGEPLAGRKLMLHAEQGFGDTFQFVRYARLVKERHEGTVIVWCPRPLIPLLSECPYIDQLTVEGESLPEFDVHLPLLSLPRIFGTRLENVPNQAPYLFPNSELAERWRRELSYIGAFKVGINWQGNPRYRGDRHRSIPLEKFAPLAEIPGVRLISLQKGLGTEQIAKTSERFSLTELPPHRDERAGSFMDTAAILTQLDLVVSSDTSLVHLAGGLGVPVWLALPRAADWRWLLDREDCPWYPTMRLFRQRKQGEWDEIFDRIAFELGQLSRQRRRESIAPFGFGSLFDQASHWAIRREPGANGCEPGDALATFAELDCLAEDEVAHCEDLRSIRNELEAVHAELLRNEGELLVCETANEVGPRLLEALKVRRTLQTRREALIQAIDSLIGAGPSAAPARSVAPTDSILAGQA